MKLFNVSRIGFALRWSFYHLIGSLFVALLSSVVVFSGWYPNPWRTMLGVTQIFLLVVLVDVICGPMLTLVLASPRKSVRERWVDLTLVVVIQLGALFYGLFSVFSARPVVLAFETDRFVVVTANEVQTTDFTQISNEFQNLPWFGLQRVAVRAPRSSQERLESLEASLNGVPPSLRPSWWIPYSEVQAEIARRAKPLTVLQSDDGAQKVVLEDAVRKSKIPAFDLRYLPLTSSKDLGWIALLDKSGQVVGYAQIDGFK